MKSMKKSGRKTCVIAEKAVPLHRDSKTSWEAFPGLHLQAEERITAGSPLRPMKTEKRTGTRLSKPYCRAPREEREPKAGKPAPIPSAMLNYSILSEPECDTPMMIGLAPCSGLCRPFGAGGATESLGAIGRRKPGRGDMIPHPHPARPGPKPGKPGELLQLLQLLQLF